MSKELTPLQALNKIANIEMKEQYKADKGGFVYCVVSDEYSKELKVIEKALKKLDKPKEIVGTTTVDKALEQFLIDSCPEVAKKLKALEIIKEKEVDIGWLKRAKDLHEYNSGMGINSYSALNQEEYELLKEILEQ